MNWPAVRIFILKDLYLSRRQLSAYFAAGLISAVATGVPHPTVSFVGFLLMITVAIGAGMHLLGMLLLGESIDHTRLFAMSMPVSLRDYSMAKIAVILLTYLIPWAGMLVIAILGSAILPWSERGALAIIPTIFGFLLATFMVQLVVAVITESIGWTISTMVAGNVALNVFFLNFLGHPSVKAVSESDTVSWPPMILGALGIELAVALVALGLAFYFQNRPRDLI